jgi:hypothetical protein
VDGGSPTGAGQQTQRATAGLPAHPTLSPVLPISRDLSFLSLSLFLSPSFSLLWVLCHPDVLGSLPTWWEKEGLSHPSCILFPFPVGLQIPSDPQTALCWASELTLELQSSGAWPAGWVGAHSFPFLGNWEGPGAPTIMKQKRLLMTSESWKVIGVWE